MSKKNSKKQNNKQMFRRNTEQSPRRSAEQDRRSTEQVFRKEDEGFRKNSERMIRNNGGGVMRRDTEKGVRGKYIEEDIFDIARMTDMEPSLSHYFTDDGPKDEMRHFEYKTSGKTLQITSNSGVFSKNHVDRASHLLIQSLEKESMLKNQDSRMRIADLGTGYGIILLSLMVHYPRATGTGYEVSNRALRLARINAKKNGMRDRIVFESGDLRKAKDSNQPFDLIVSNPPIRAGKDVVYAFYDFAFRNLAPGGAFYIVISKNQGADSSKKYLESLFGNAEIIKKESEFRVIKMTKTAEKMAETEGQRYGILQ